MRKLLLGLLVFPISAYALTPFEVFKNNLGVSKGVNVENEKQECRMSGFFHSNSDDTINLAGEIKLNEGKKADWWGAVEVDDRYFRIEQETETTGVIKARMPGSIVFFHFNKKDLRIFQYDLKTRDVELASCKILNNP